MLWYRWIPVISVKTWRRIHNVL
jgi:hypothetical protein